MALQAGSAYSIYRLDLAGFRQDKAELLSSYQQMQSSVADALGAARTQAGASEEKFLQLAGAMSQQALAAGDAARANEIYDQALNNGTAASEQGTAASLRFAQAEAQHLAALG